MHCLHGRGDCRTTYNRQPSAYTRLIRSRLDFVRARLLGLALYCLLDVFAFPNSKLLQKIKAGRLWRLCRSFKRINLEVI